jgi:syntaxin 5
MANAVVPRHGGSKDRTLEFQGFVKDFASRTGPMGPGRTGETSNGNVSSLGQQASTSSHSEFSKRASAIGMGIHSTSQKLQKLAQLAKRTSMFDDPAQEINELATIVKHDIQALNQSITDLQTYLGNTGNKQSADHSSNVVDSLRSRLKDTTKEFKDVLTLRTDNLKVHQERKSLFASTEPGKQALYQPGASFLPQNARKSLRAAKGDMGEQQPLLSADPANRGVDQAQMQLAQPDAYLTSRQEALHQVESTILELGNIFQQLASMVHEQGEMAVRIDENVDETLTQVEAGQAQLLKYLNTISSNRWLLLKVFGIIMLALIFFLVFVA